MTYQGPLWTDYPGTSPLNAAELNCLVPSQNAYLQAGGIPSTASGLTITQPATWVVLQPPSGASPVALAIAATTIPCAAGGTNQDNYVDVTPAGTYVVVSGAVNFVPAAPTAGNLRLYKATTTSSNTVVSFPVTTLAATAPAVPSTMGIDGSGAAATVAIPTSVSSGLRLDGSGVPVQADYGRTTGNGDWIFKGPLRGASPNTQLILGTSTFFDGTGTIQSAVSGTAFFQSAAGPAILLQFTPGSITGSAPFFVISLISIYSLSQPPGYSLSLPYGFRTRRMEGLLISEVGSYATDPHIWLDSILDVVVPSPYGNGPAPQTWQYAHIYAKSLSVGVTYKILVYPLFGP